MGFPANHDMEHVRPTGEHRASVLADYYRNGGILHYVLRNMPKDLVAAAST